MADIIVPNTDNIEQQFSALSSIREQYDSSQQRKDDEATIQHENDVAGPSQEEIQRQNDRSGDSILDNIGEIIPDIVVGAARSIGELGKFIGVTDKENPFNLNPPDDITSSLVQGAAQFAVPFTGVFKGVSVATKLFRLMKGSPKLKLVVDSMVAGVPVDFAAFAPQDGNLANFALSSGVVSEDSRVGAALKEYLAVSSKDSDLKARSQNALAGLLGSVMFEKIVKLAGGTLKVGANGIKNLTRSDVQLLDTKVPHVDDTFGQGAVRSGEVATELSDASLKEATDEAGAHFVDTLDKASSEDIAKIVKNLPDMDTAVIHETNKEVSDVAEFYHAATPEVQDKMASLFKDVLDGKKLEDVDLESLSPFNLSKLNTPLERKTILAQMGKIMEDRLPRNTGDPKVRRAMLDAEINKIVKYFGVSPEQFITHLKTVTNDVEGAIAYIQSSKVLTDLQVQRALKLGKDHMLSRSPENFRNFTEQLTSAVETAQATSGLGTAFGRGLAEFKSVADAKTLASQTNLIKAQLAHDVITSTPELGIRRAGNLVKLDELAKFEKKIDPDRFASNEPRAPRTDAQKAAANIKRLQKRIKDINEGTIKAPKRELTDFENALKEEIKAIQAEKQLDEIFSASNLQSRAILKASRMSLGAKTRDALLEVYINGLLSSVKTSVVNFSGNTTAIVSSIIDRTYAGLAGDSVNGVTLGEAAQLTWSYVSSMPDMWKTFWYAAKHGPSSDAVKLDFIKPHDRSLTKELWGASGNTGKAVDLIGKVVNLPGQMLLAADEAFKMVNYRAEINALSFRKAKKVLGEGADSKSIALKHSEIKNDVLNHQDILDEAKKFSELNTFTNHLPEIDHVDLETGKIHQVGGLSRTFKQLIDRDRTGLMRVFIPFFQTPVNLISYAGQRTPFIRRFSDSLMNDLKSTNLATKQLAEAKVATGNMMWATAMGMAMSGNFTGPPPVDADLRRAQEDAGVKWYSYMTDNGWVSYNRFDPLGIILGGAATMAIMGKSMVNLTKQGSEQGFNDDIYDKYQETFANATVGIVHLVTDRHYLQGFSNLVDFLTGDSRGFSKGINNLATAVNPAASFYSSFRRSVIRAVDNEKDSELRQEDLDASDPLTAGWNTMSQALDEMFRASLSSTTPGYGELPASKNLMGETKFYPGTSKSDELHVEPFRIMSNFFSTGINPFEVSKKSKSSVMNKLGQLESTLQGPEMVKSISGVTLSQDEHQYFTDVWTNLNKPLDKWVSSKAFNAMPEGAQLTRLENTININKNIAESQTRIKFSRIQEASFKDGMNTIRRSVTPQVATSGLQNIYNQGQ